MKLTGFIALLPACFFVISLPVHAQQPWPEGIFCSCPPTTGIGPGSVMPQVAAKDFVSGVLVRVAWKDLEAQPGVYRWSLLDSQFTAASAYGKRIALAVMNGPQAPDWLYDAGAKEFAYSFRGNPTRMPVPWDSVHLARWTDFVSKLGARYDGHSQLALVHMTHATANGFEMQLPFSPQDIANWTLAGWTPQRHIESWTRVLDAFASAFPTAPLDADVHPVLKNDSVAAAVAAYSRSVAEARAGVFAAWWSQNNTVTYAAQYTLLLDAAQRGRSGVQMVTNGTNDSAGFGPGGLAAAMDLAAAGGIRYFEVWNADILNPVYDALLRSHALRTSIEHGAMTSPRSFTASAYPHPATRDAVINIGTEDACVVRGSILSMLGRMISVFDGIAVPAGGGSVPFHAMLNGGEFPGQGLYVIILSAGERMVPLKLIVR